MPAAVDAFQRRLLFDRVEAVDDDAVGLQRQRLADGRGPALDRAGAVQYAHLPADLRGGLLDARW